METETLTNTETHKVITTDSTGAESSVKEVHTSETEVPVIPAADSAPAEVAEKIAEEITDEGAIDEVWLTGKFSELSAQISTLSQQIAANQLSSLETTNQLIAMNQSLQQTITEMAAKIPQPISSTPKSSQETPTPPTVNPQESASGDGQKEVVTNPPPQRKRVRRI